MKNSLWFILLVLILFAACNRQTRCSERIIRNYYAGFNKSDFNLITRSVDDQIVTTEMEYILTKNKTELYRQFQWDSVFQPNYRILEIKKDSNAYVATLWKTCRRIDFLQDTAITFKVRIDFKGNRISGIRLTQYIDLNFDKWQYRTEALIAWVDQNHPEWSGFNNDLTKTGAQHYLKAVEEQLTISNEQ